MSSQNSEGPSGMAYRGVEYGGQFYGVAERPPWGEDIWAESVREEKELHMGRAEETDNQEREELSVSWDIADTRLEDRQTRTFRSALPCLLSLSRPLPPSESSLLNVISLLYLIWHIVC